MRQAEKGEEMKFTRQQLAELENRGMISAPKSLVPIIEMELPFDPWSANKWTNKKQGHFIFAGYKQKVRRVVELYFPLNAVVPRKARMKLVRLYTGKRFDRDNLIAGLKPLVDAIKERGYLIDDNDKVFFCEYEQEPSDRKATLVRIEYQ